MKIKIGKRISAKEFENIGKELALDLQAIFTVFEDMTMDLLEKAANEEWTVDKLLDEIDILLEGGFDGEETM